MPGMPWEDTGRDSQELSRERFRWRRRFLVPAEQDADSDRSRSCRDSGNEEKQSGQTTPVMPAPHHPKADADPSSRDEVLGDYGGGH